jgi:hypothetical protein
MHAIAMRRAGPDLKHCGIGRSRGGHLLGRGEWPLVIGSFVGGDSATWQCGAASADAATCSTYMRQSSQRCAMRYELQ